MTLEDFERKLSDNGWRHFCWENVWEKDNKRISFPEHNPFIIENDINEVKIVYDNGKENIIITNENVNELFE